MDEKTEELRDIFMDVSGTESVTESQSDGRGSLADGDDVDERVGAVIDRMRERYAFETAMDEDELVTVVRGFYTGQSDADLAAELDTTAAAVIEARLDLQLVRDSDIEGEFDVGAFRRRVVSEEPVEDAALAEQFDLTPERVAHLRRVVEAQAAARQTSHRFQSEFEDALTEAGLSMQLTAAVRETGLDEATEDIDSLDSDADVSM